MAEFITEVLGKRKNKISASLDDSACSPDNKKSRKSVSSDAEIAKEDPIFFFELFFLFSVTKYLLTILTYKQHMVLTLLTKLYATYKNNTYLQCKILTLLTILYSTYNTKRAILTMRYLHY